MINVVPDQRSRSHCMCSLVQKSVFVSVGLYSDMKIGEERDFMSRIVSRNLSSLHIPLPLYRYRQHKLSITANYENMRSYD